MKLTYFNGRGLAETSRLILAINNVQYEDYRYPMKVNDWKTHDIEKKEFDDDKASGKLKKSLNKVPFLLDDGVIISQSKTIERYLARKYNMMGDNDLEHAVIDSICEWVRDFKDLYQKVRRVEEEKREEAMKEWFEVTLVEKLELLEHILGDSGHSVGARLSLADVVLYSFITQFFDNKEGALNATNSTPKLRKIVDSVSQNENLKVWLETRPATVF